MRWSLLLLVLALPAAADVPLLQVVSRRALHPASYVPVSAPQPLSPPLAVIVEEGSGWEGRLEAVLGKASAIFAPCGLALGEAEVLTVRWSAEGLRRLNNGNPYDGPAQAAVMDEPQLPARRPLVFLFKKGTVPSTASAYNLTAVTRLGRSYPKVPKLLNTVWMTLDHELSTPPQRAPSYSTLAHELTHLFGDLGHTRAEPNLMSESDRPGAHTGDLLPEQCAEVRKLHGL